MQKFSCLIIILFIAVSTKAQQLKADIKKLAFIQGEWFVNHEWGYMEEYWSEPIGSNMVSCYRCVKDGKIIFYEFVVIEQSDSVPVMILRHFNPGNIGWETKEQPNYYPLTSLDNKTAVFTSNDGSIVLQYTLIGTDKLDVILKEKKKGGNVETTAFHYNRKQK